MIDHASAGPRGETDCASSAEMFLDALGHRMRAGVGASARSAKLAVECARIAGVPPPNAFWWTIAA